MKLSRLLGGILMLVSIVFLVTLVQLTEANPAISNNITGMGVAYMTACILGFLIYACNRSFNE